MSGTSVVDATSVDGAAVVDVVGAWNDVAAVVDVVGAWNDVAAVVDVVGAANDGSDESEISVSEKSGVSKRIWFLSWRFFLKKTFLP